MDARALVEAVVAVAVTPVVSAAMALAVIVGILYSRQEGISLVGLRPALKE